MGLLAVVGIVALVFGILVLLAPDLLKSWSKSLDKMLILFDEKIKAYRVSIGIISVAVGICALFLVYYFKVKGGI